MMKLSDTYQLSNGVRIPILGFGTWQTPDGEIAFESVKKALRVGYRHIDTAAAYGNEASVAKAIKASKIPRNKIFLTTKLNSDALDYDSAKQAIDRSLSKMNLDYIDLLLIHWPNPLATRPHFEERNAAVWQAMEAGVGEGKIKSLGVANFQSHHLDALYQSAKIKPVVNQIYCNPSDQQETIVAYNRAHDILTEAYSPLGTGEIFRIKALEDLARKYQHTVAQIVLRWHLQKGYLPLPKSVTPTRIEENIKLFDFSLQDDDMAFIDRLHGALLPHKFPDQVQF